MTVSSTDIASPEKRLLVCCARTRLEPHVAHEVCELAASPLDWEFVIAEAAANSVLPLLARQLLTAAPDIAPPAQLERLKNAARANTVRCLQLTAELIKIVDLFGSHGIQAFPYKGPVLAVEVYGDLTLREFDDLDIILRQRDMAKANHIIKDLGYRPNFPWDFDSGSRSSVVPGEYDYRDEARRLVVELHTERTLRHFPFPPDLDDLARRSISVTLSGHEITTFGNEDMLPILCIHGAKDFWERISWIADISEFIHSRPSIDWDRVFHRADSLGARRMLHLGLALANGFLDAALPGEILARVRGDSVAARVASEVKQRQLSRESPERAAAERFHFRRHMLEGSVAGWRYALRLATLPADEDSAAMRLPRVLAPLYIVLRPLRLLSTYGSPAGRARRRG